MILLDTDILTHLFDGHVRVREKVAQQSDVATTIISRVEVLSGRFAAIVKAADGAQLERAQVNLVKSEAFLGAMQIEMVDSTSAAVFDRLRADRKLRKIGRADLLIASIALARRATLLTRNLRHFRAVAGLPLANWVDD